VEVAVEVVFKGMVMGMEVTMVDPWELVVVRFPKERDDDVGLGVPLLVLPGSDDVLLGVLVPVSDWAAEGVAANARAEERTMRERNRFILVRFRTANGAKVNDVLKIPLRFSKLVLRSTMSATSVSSE
jgi:hypothetical protein